MTEAQANQQLRAMLRSLTPGSVLHLLSELFSTSARRARRRGDNRAEQQSSQVASALFVVGLGVDGAWPGHPPQT